MSTTDSVNLEVILIPRTSSGVLMMFFFESGGSYQNHYNGNYKRNVSQCCYSKQKQNLITVYLQECCPLHCHRHKLMLHELDKGILYFPSQVKRQSVSECARNLRCFPVITAYDSFTWSGQNCLSLFMQTLLL